MKSKSEINKSPILRCEESCGVTTHFFVSEVALKSYHNTLIAYEQLYACGLCGKVRRYGYTQEACVPSSHRDALRPTA